MRQMQQMQQRLAKIQEELAEATVDGSAGGGAVTVTMTGQQQVRAVKIDPAVVDPEDVEMLQDLVLAAVNEALRGAMELQSRAAGAGAGGFDPQQALEMLGGMGGLGGLGGMGGGPPQRPPKRRR